MKQLQSLILLVLLSLFYSCQSGVNQQNTNKDAQSQGISTPGPKAIIYKTSANYNNMVPIIMNAEKTEIVSFPAPRDLKYKGKVAIPSQLEDGFLLDKRGINENVVFINITYDEYMALDKAPSKEELFDLIIDRDPLVIMYECGNRWQYDNEVEALNKHITDNDFSTFKQLK